MILHTPIPIIFFFSCFSTWGSHNHFVEVRYIIGGPIKRSIVGFSSPSRSSPYSNNPLYLCFFFLGRWYTYNRSHIRCGSCVFMIVKGIINLGLSIQPMKYVVWSFQGLDLLYHFLLFFKIPNSYFCVLCALVGSTFFVELFMTKVLHENLGTMSNLLMLTYP
jgi:hypothetical protein